MKCVRRIWGKLAMKNLPDTAALKRIVLALLSLALLQLAASSQGSDKCLWLNLTGSEPIGLYRAAKFEKLKRGDMVIVTVPPEFDRYLYTRRWLPQGWSLLKHVGAVPGDVYCVADSTLFINGVRIGPVYAADRHGLPLPQLRGCHVVPQGKFLPVAVRIPRSFDGRYMGPLDVSLIRAVARPLLVYD